MNPERCLNHFILDFQKNPSQMGEGAIWSKYTSVRCDSLLMQAGRRHKGGGTELSIACRSEHIVSVQLFLNNDKDKKAKTRKLIKNPQIFIASTERGVQGACPPCLQDTSARQRCDALRGEQEKASIPNTLTFHLGQQVSQQVPWTETSR